ncbi:Alpha/Beta hydrolase protein [Entophlyctis helioformis]|nr:Alpha/Beta hydrolase protein [Entophlyctis helioformis]
MPSTSVESWTKRPDGRELYTRTWAPAGSAPVVAVVVFLHGLGEHISRYDHVFPPFADAGIKVVSFDQRGFGKTAHRNGIIGDNEGTATVFADIKSFIDSSRLPATPLFVMGHSMGGALALRYCSQHPDGLRGVIASAPGIGPGSATTPNLVERFLLMVAPSIIPSVPLKGKARSCDLTRDPVVNKAYDDDPFVHPWGTIATYKNIVDGCSELQNQVSKTFDLPILMVHGSKDVMTCPKMSKAFFDSIPSKDKTYKSLEGFYHEAHNEIGADKNVPVKLYVEWILERSK